MPNDNLLRRFLEYAYSLNSVWTYDGRDFTPKAVLGTLTRNNTTF
ncbi:hypothetical protein [Saccharolobus solfataricus]|nr:hypothetical protein [Saccharolobus solfataricus]